MKNAIPMVKGDRVLITNDAMFSYVMQDPEICKGVVERILGRKIEKISYPEGQKSLKELLTDKGIRLDIFFQDEKNVMYDVEMQTTDSEDLEERTSFYHIKMKRCLKQGQEYKDLPQTYVIFICTFDRFGYDIPRYTFDKMCREVPNLCLNGEGTTIFVNLACNNFVSV